MVNEEELAKSMGQTVPERDPSYGIIRFARVSGGGRNFFGTTVKPDHYFQLHISRAKVSYSDLSGEQRISEDRQGPVICELHLTAHQFSELITTMNIGEGVPCTLDYVDGKFVGHCPDQKSRMDTAIDLLASRPLAEGDKYDNAINKIQDLLATGKPIGKKDRDIINRELEFMRTRMKENAKFYQKQIVEVGESVKSEIKTEMDAQAMAIVHKLGMESLSTKIGGLLEEGN